MELIYILYKLHMAFNWPIVYLCRIQEKNLKIVRQAFMKLERKNRIFVGYILQNHIGQMFD